MDSEPKWRRFEQVAAEIQHALAPNAEVTLNDHILGKDSGVGRQIDITVRQKIGQYEILVAIDCKDYKTPVDIKDVDSFAGMIRDIQAHKGAMIAANGFTNGAKQVGIRLGLDLYRLVDTDSVDWQNSVSIPMLCDFR
ncbi:MAG: restriction endonuclease, partial [Chloroflexi bacterium]|nr:restriction endonuclease [Chloroflexota bacterium]